MVWEEERLGRNMDGMEGDSSCFGMKVRIEFPGAV